MSNIINKNLDYCPFCKEKLIPLVNKISDTKADVICPTYHTDDKDIGVWGYRNDEKSLNTLSIQVLQKENLWIRIIYKFKTNETHIMNVWRINYTTGSSKPNNPINMIFNKIIEFNFDDEEQFKNKLQTILTFS